MKSKKATKKSSAKQVVKTAKLAGKAKPTTLAVSKVKSPAVRQASKKPGSKTAARKPRAARSRDAAPGHPAIFYRLNTLLHTVRSIAEFEDHLCTILHEIKTTGAASGALSHELAEVLEDMPSTHFTQELQAVRAVLEEASPRVVKVLR